MMNLAMHVFTTQRVHHKHKPLGLTPLSEHNNKRHIAKKDFSAFFEIYTLSSEFASCFLREAASSKRVKTSSRTLILMFSCETTLEDIVV